MDKTSLGDRMKGYEGITRNFLTRRMPTIIRLDGKAFHTLTKKLDRPYDKDFRDCMIETTRFLVDNIMGCVFAYVQSDEISLLLIDYKELETEPWFMNNIQKIVSVSASLATAKFNELYREKISDEKKVCDLAFFDSRVFSLPREEVVNYFIWRQQDATRNSIQGLGQSEFGHKRMHGKNTSKVQDMLMLEKGINWNDVDTYFKRGGCVYRGIESKRIMTDVKSPPDKLCNVIAKETGFRPEQKIINIETLGYEYRENVIIVDMEIPIFTKDREFIQVFVDCDIEKMYNRKDVDLAVGILEGIDKPFINGIDNIGFIIPNEDDALDFQKYVTQGDGE